MSQPRTVEEKLYEAFMGNRGVRLTADDVCGLVLYDEAILTRLANAARCEACVEEDFSGIDTSDKAPRTWAALVKSYRTRG